nr:unnamed protein product [Spirometra erinaceieuropaei]
MAYRYSTAVVTKPSRKVFGTEFEQAQREYDLFVDALRQLDVNILEYDVDERRPHAHKVADVAVIINGTALMCRPYGGDRQSEVNVIRQTLKKEMGLTIAELNTEHAQLEGSDVLFTGQEIIVGISIFENKIDYTRYPLSLPTLFKHGVPLYKLALLSDRVRRQLHIVSTMP